MKKTLCALLAVIMPGLANAATYQPWVDEPERYGQLSGFTRLNITHTVTDYYANIAPAPGAIEVGSTAKKTIESRYAGVVEYDFYGPGYHDYSIDLLSYPIWAQSNDGGYNYITTTCGFIVNFCVGHLASPDYSVDAVVRVDATIRINPSYTSEGFPLALFLSEEVIFQNRNNPDDFHIFTASGFSRDAGHFANVPLPASFPLLAGTLIGLSALRMRRRRQKTNAAAL